MWQHSQFVVICPRTWIIWKWHAFSVSPTTRLHNTPKSIKFYSINLHEYKTLIYVCSLAHHEGWAPFTENVSGKYVVERSLELRSIVICSSTGIIKKFFGDCGTFPGHCNIFWLDGCEHSFIWNKEVSGNLYNMSYKKKLQCAIPTDLGHLASAHVLHRSSLIMRPKSHHYQLNRSIMVYCNAYWYPPGAALIIILHSSNHLSP